MSWFRWQGIPTQEIGVRSLGPEDASRRRKWQPTPVSSPGKCHGQRSLMGRSPWVVSKLGSIQQLRTEVIPKTTLKCVCVCVCVCVCLYLLLPSWSLSRNLHVFLPLYLLTASRRPVRLALASPRRSGSGSGACAGQLSPLAWVRPQSRAGGWNPRYRTTERRDLSSQVLRRTRVSEHDLPKHAAGLTRIQARPSSSNLGDRISREPILRRADVRPRITSPLRGADPAPSQKRGRKPVPPRPRRPRARGPPRPSRRVPAVSALNRGERIHRGRPTPQ